MSRLIGRHSLLLLSILLSSNRVGAVDNGLAITPQMGWNTWNSFGCATSEDILLSSGQRLIALGFKDLGYNYVLQDDCWSAGRNSSGYLQADPSKFPHGMAYVADNLHSMGLGFGIYSDAGTLTCARYEGSLGHETIDAQTWASWGVDYVKYDNCFNEGQSGTPLITYNRYKAMASALNATGRPMLYSMCNWGEDFPWKWAQTVANSWRITGDAFDTFDRPDKACPCTGDEGIDCALPGFRCSVMNIINKMANFPDKGINGAWNDMDLLEVGNGGMTDSEYKIHFSMWSALKSPLIISTDVRSLSPYAYSIYSNPAVLAVSQDPNSRPVFRRWRYAVPDIDAFGQGEIQMWSGTLSGSDRVVLLLNAGTSAREMNATLEDIFWDAGPGGTTPEVGQSWDVYDLWGNRMDNNTAQAIIDAANAVVNGNTTVDPNSIGTQFRYNATEMGGFAPGLAQNLPVLLGKKIGTIKPHGSLTAHVDGHSIGMFRLRMSGGNSTSGALRRQEL